MSLPLEMELVWVIECWRCANVETYGGSETEARETAERMGWAKVGDGFQVCPRCSGRGPL